MEFKITYTHKGETCEAFIEAKSVQKAKNKFNKRFIDCEIKDVVAQ